MTCKLKRLALVLAAVLVAGGAVNSVAFATEFTSSSYPFTYSGSQAVTELHELVLDGYKTTCEYAEFSGESKEASTTVTITPAYSKCTAFGLSATITMNGCNFLLHLPAGSATHVQATLSLVCPVGKEVTIDAGGGACIAHIPPFAGKNHVTVWNNHPNVTMYFTVSNFKATLTDVSPFFCPFAGETTVETASYTGHLTIKGNGRTIDVG